MEISSVGLWCVYLVVWAVVYVCAALLGRWSNLSSILLAATVAYVLILVIPKSQDTTGSMDTAGYISLAAISSFLLLSAVTWLLATSEKSVYWIRMKNCLRAARD